MEQLKFNNQNGQSLVEILVAIGLTAILLPALLTSFVASREGNAQEAQRLGATTIMKEMTEGVRSVKERDWTLLTNGTFYPTLSGSQWVLNSGTQVQNGYTSQVIISDVLRDSNGNIAAVGTLDPATKKIDYTVTWTTPINGTIQQTEYMTRFVGNDARIHTSQADFDLSGNVKTNTRSTGSGTVELVPASSNGTFTDDYTTAASYTYNATQIEVIGGYAQLRNTGSISNGTTTNQGFDSNLTGWTFTRFNTNVSQTGTRVATGGNPGGYGSINFPARANSLAGGFFRQPVVTTGPIISATLSFSYSITAYSATPDSFRIYAWIDSGTGAPTTIAWDSGPITATSGWINVSNVNVASFMPTAATRQLKLGAIVDYPSVSRGPYTVGFDNIDLDWSTGTTSYPTVSPSINPNTSFTTPGITSWTSFTQTAILNGGSINYQLSDDDGTTWRYWNGSTWALASSSANSNSATVVNSQIGSFPVVNNKVRVRAFLVSNGSQLVRLDKVEIGYSGSGGANSGTYTSATIDTGGVSGFNRLRWTEFDTANTTVRLRLATNNNNSTWNYVGPDGTTGTYFTGGSGTIPLIISNARYLRYEISFTTTNTDNPNVSEVSINYSP